MPTIKSTICQIAMVLFSFILACPRLPAQDYQEAQPAAFLHSNDGFGARLLNLLHEEAPDRNIAVAPLPVSLAFAALLNGSIDSQNIQEIISTFSWERNFSRDIAGRMLLARFEKPKSNLDLIANPAKARDGAALKQNPPITPHAIWFSAALLYRGKESLSQNFMDRARYYFGLDFREVGADTPQSTILSQNWDSSLPMPAIKGQNDFWMTSFLHLRTSWAGNTFVDAKR